ncbi:MULTISPECIES: hypothetical protein [Paenibacillus]|uniref:BclA C-terminal domain-containing protein n=1 Tax=Paenibacillus arenosi TaxID=2774142 RepID=A0ABR9AVK2_9BACL|nr:MULTISPECIES: hypothetical protein [Paenibacillus]MBD8498104.1 hypothetical protein [Paenibacillus arenosi]
MPNQTVFNTSSMPLFTSMTNTYTNPGVGSSAAQAAASAGVGFRLTTASASVGGSQNLLLQITNPAASGKNIYLVDISGGTTAAATINVSSGGTIAGGTTPVPVNTRLGTATTSVVTTRQLSGTLGGTPTTFLTTYVTAGAYLLVFDGGLIVPANQVLTVSLGVGALTGSINLQWWEL